MRNYFVTIEEMVGEYRFDTLRLMRIDKEYDIASCLHNLCMFLYEGADVEKMNNHYSINDYDVALKIKDYKEITEEEYKILNRYIPEFFVR